MDDGTFKLHRQISEIQSAVAQINDISHHEGKIIIDNWQKTDDILIFTLIARLEASDTNMSNFDGSRC